MPRPLTRAFDPTSLRSFEFLREQDVLSGTTTVRGIRIYATSTGLLTERTVILQDNQGAPIITTTHIIFFYRTIPGVHDGDQLLDLTTGTRYVVAKVFQYPQKTVVYATRQTAGH